ncbi:MAG: recombinase family protein, partial [Betaproteobacteria bacterium]|nr:recombinase family protein [Betaproteobacteria bacterium]
RLAFQRNQVVSSFLGEFDQKSVCELLTNPAYAGAYAYGKSETKTHYDAGQARQAHRRKPRKEWLALIHNAHEGYVAWEQFEQIQHTIGANLRVREQAGAAQGGAALMSGILRCRRCGRKLSVRYTGSRHDALRYCCERGWLDNGDPRCIAFGGVAVDEAMAREILRVVQPAAIEAAILASEDTARKHDEVLEALKRDLEAAHYSARRAQKQYDAADPENRLVADELERRWNQALQRVREIELRIGEQNPSPERAQEFNRADFEQLAADLESVWKHPDADPRLKKRIVRTLIHEVVVDIDSQAGEVILVIHWKGGVHSELRLPRRRRGQNAAHTPPEVLDAVRALARICTDDLIAGVLNRNAIPTGRGNRWTRERVTALRSHHKIACYDANRCEEEGWMNLTNAARFMKVSPKTLRLATERGEITADHPLQDGPWIFNREVLRSQAATGLLERARSNQRHPALPIQQNDLFDLSTT